MHSHHTPLLTLTHLLLLLLATATATAKPTTPQRNLTSSSPINYPYDYSSLRCPTSGTEKLITPTYGTQGSLFTVCSSLYIAASPSRIRDAVLDYKSYPLWNPFVTSVALPSNVTATPRDVYVGMDMTFTTAGLVPGVDTSSDEILSIMDGVGLGDGVDGKPYLLVAWWYDDNVAALGARAEHPNIMVDQGDGSSWFLSYETYYAGLLTPTIGLLKSNLQEQFEAQAMGLKSYVEGLP